MKVSNTLKITVATGLTAVAGLSQAAGAVDPAPIVSTITDSGATAAAVGTAVLGVIVIIKTFKYIRQAF